MRSADAARSRSWPEVDAGLAGVEFVVEVQRVLAEAPIAQVEPTLDFSTWLY